MTQDKPASGCARPLFEDHTRQFAENRYVYPVLSRRAGGISIGVNLSPDKLCNFHCVYCQVDRELRAAGAERAVPLKDAGYGMGEPVDVDLLAAELDDMVDAVVSGRLFEGTRFGQTPASLQRLNDIAISGNGEPTLCPRFAEVVQLCAEARRRRRLDDVKLVLITNSTLLDRESVRRGLAVLDGANGEIWAKLDAGTEAYYRRVARSMVPFSKILDNVLITAQTRPIVIQTLLMRLEEKPPSGEEITAYCQRLTDILAAGGQIRLVQLHTVARRPAEAYVAPLDDRELDAIGEKVHCETGLPTMVSYH